MFLMLRWFTVTENSIPPILGAGAGFIGGMIVGDAMDGGLFDWVDCTQVTLGVMFSLCWMRFLVGQTL